MGVGLILTDPEIANRDCGECQRFMFDEFRGTVKIWRGMKMPRHGPTPCRTSIGCAKGTPEKQNVLNKRNTLAFIHYSECAATGDFPDDAIVRQNAGLIRRVEKQIERDSGASIEHQV